MQREIGIIIRVKDAAKAKEEIKGIVDNKLLGNVKAATDNFNKMGNEVQKSGEKARKTKGEFDSFFTSITKGVGALYAIRRGINMAFGSFEAGAGLERAAIQFESSIGNINTMLPQLRAATRGTVEDMRLLQTANRAVIEGLDPRNLTKMYQMATVASRKLGLESEQAIQTISNAIVRQDESALTTLGTILKTNVGLKVQTAIMSKNAGVMSGAAAIAIRQSVIMDELNRKFGGFNALQEDGVEIIQQFRAAMSNLRMSLGPIMGIVMAPLLKVVSAIANGLSRMLNVLKDNKTFRAVVQTLGTFIATIASSKAITMIGFLVGKLALFAGGLKALGIAIAATGIYQLFENFQGIGKAIQFAGTALSVFYQLVSSFDNKTGLSTVLTKDKEALGSFYSYVKMAAQAFVSVQAFYSGMIRGIKNTASGTVEAIEAIYNKITTLPVIGGIMRSIGDGVRYVGAMFKSAADSARDFFNSLNLNQLDGIKRIGENIASFAPLGIAVRAAGSLIDSPSSPQASQIPTSEIQPQVREQNVQAVSSQEDYLPALLKSMNRSADTLDMLLQKEEGKEVQRRMSPSLR
jgi:hypothetical protein